MVNKFPALSHCELCSYLLRFSARFGKELTRECCQIAPREKKSWNTNQHVVSSLHWAFLLWLSSRWRPDCQQQHRSLRYPLIICSSLLNYSHCLNFSTFCEFKNINCAVLGLYVTDQQAAAPEPHVDLCLPHCGCHKTKFKKILLIIKAIWRCFYFLFYVFKYVHRISTA